MSQILFCLLVRAPFFFFLLDLLCFAMASSFDWMLLNVVFYLRSIVIETGVSRS